MGLPAHVARLVDGEGPLGAGGGRAHVEAQRGQHGVEEGHVHGVLLAAQELILDEGDRIAPRLGHDDGFQELTLRPAADELVALDRAHRNGLEALVGVEVVPGHLLHEAQGTPAAGDLHVLELPRRLRGRDANAPLLWVAESQAPRLQAVFLPGRLIVLAAAEGGRQRGGRDGGVGSGQLKRPDNWCHRRDQGGIGSIGGDGGGETAGPAGGHRGGGVGAGAQGAGAGQPPLQRSDARGHDRQNEQQPPHVQGHPTYTDPPEIHARLPLQTWS